MRSGFIQQDTNTTHCSLNFFWLTDLKKYPHAYAYGQMYLYGFQSICINIGYITCTDCLLWNCILGSWRSAFGFNSTNVSFVFMLKLQIDCHKQRYFRILCRFTINQLDQAHFYLQYSNVFSTVWLCLHSGFFLFCFFFLFIMQYLNCTYQ